MPKKCLVLNSHWLSDYQQCPQRYKLSVIEKLEPRETYAPFERGTLISECLEEYYKLLRAKELNPATLMEIITSKVRPAVSVPDETRFIIERNLMQYYGHYRDNDWVPIAMENETAFSSIIHEDGEYIFVYEGRMDLMAHVSASEDALIVADHKSQARKTELYQFNNQAMGYCWATGAKFFAYNIFGLQQIKPSEGWFRRPVIAFGKDRIEDWKQGTIKWFYKIASDLEYTKSWQCEGKYSVCAYHKICEQPLVNIATSIKEREFKAKEYQSWDLPTTTEPAIEIVKTTING